MTEKVIFDTNCLRNGGSINSFFGNCSEITKFIQVAEIVIPQMVIDEIHQQLYESLIDYRNTFSNCPFTKILSIDETSVSDFDIEGFINQLLQDVAFSYSTITLSNMDYISSMRECAVKGVPPFEPRNAKKSSDKGFKDSWIYYTILEYLETIDDDYVFFMCKDGRLKESLESHPRVRVIDSFEEFEKQRASYFKEDYFIQSLVEFIGNEGLGFTIDKDDIQSVEFNIEGNWLIKAVVNEKNILFEVDFSSREILGWYNGSKLEELVDGLVNSGSFNTTDYCVSELYQTINYLSNKDIIMIIDAGVSNNQIYWKAGQEDIDEFFFTIFSYIRPHLTIDIIDKFEEYFDFKNYHK